MDKRHGGLDRGERSGKADSESRTLTGKRLDKASQEVEIKKKRSKG
jgi:hypothetical protein